MTKNSSPRARISEWVRRYLPCEIAGTSAEFAAAAVAYAATGSLAMAAVAATVGASIGYYAAAFATAVRWSYRDLAHHRRVRRAVLSTALAVRSVAVEFGPAELIDSIAVRPLAFYVGPLMFGNVLAGWVFGKLVSDVAFYACAVFSYEKFTGLLAHRRPPQTAQEQVAASTAAVSPV